MEKRHAMTAQAAHLQIKLALNSASNVDLAATNKSLVKTAAQAVNREHFNLILAKTVVSHVLKVDTVIL